MVHISYFLRVCTKHKHMSVAGGFAKFMNLKIFWTKFVPIEMMTFVNSQKKQIWLTGFFCFPLLLNLQVDNARRHGILLEAMQALTKSWELEIETENHSPTLPISPPPHTIISPPLLRNCSPQLTLPPPIPMPLAPLPHHCSWISLLRQQCPWGCLGLGSIHALALAACPWQHAFVLATACLGLGCVPMGLPWPWQHACLGFGCLLMAMCLRFGCYMPSPWLRAHRAALSTAACIPWICDGRAT